MEPTAKRPLLRGRRFRVDPLLTGCVLALIAFPVLAWIAAAGLPVEPRPQAPPVVASGADGDACSLRQVPVFEDAPDLAAALAGPSQMRAALRAGMADVLDPPAVTALLRLVESDETVTIKGGESVDPLTVPYPYRYPAIERLLPAEFADPARANDLGALLILAAAGFEGESLYAPFPNAGFAAFAVLDRARSGDACAPQLNLAFLLSADTNPRDDDVAREYELAADRCGGDPTPLWLLAQFQSQRAFIRDNADRPGQKLEERTGCSGRSTPSKPSSAAIRAWLPHGPRKPTPSCGSPTRWIPSSRSGAVSGSGGRSPCTRRHGDSTTIRSSPRARREPSPGSTSTAGPPRFSRPPRPASTGSPR